jgi:flagella basal body P-ring formation protein FlgA
MLRHMIIVACLVGFCFPSGAESFDKRTDKKVSSQDYQSISKDEYMRIFVDFLCRHLGKEQQDLIVDKLKVVGNKPLPSGKLSFQLFQKDKRKLKGYVRLTAVVYVNGVAKNRVNLFGWVDVFESVVCVARNMKKGETLNIDDVYLARKNISHFNQKILTDTNQAIGLMTKHRVKADTCLKEWMLEKSPVVVKGDIVAILAESAGLIVTAPGKVMMKGYLGELVKIQNLMSKKEIYAKVVNSSTVKVNF